MPAIAAADPMPVMVWFHGGCFNDGAPMNYDATNLITVGWLSGTALTRPRPHKATATCGNSPVDTSLLHIPLFNDRSRRTRSLLSLLHTA